MPPIEPSATAATAAAASHSFATAKAPRHKRVSLLLDTSTRAANKFGGDVLSQFLWMRLDGLTIKEIAEAIECDEEIISEAITAWQTQIEAREGEQFTPKARNWRRWRNRRSCHGKAVTAARLAA